MASKHSYTITLSNNRTEKEGIQLILEDSSNYFEPDSKGRKDILNLLGISTRYARAFDLIHVENFHKYDSVLEVQDLSTLTLIELKTTKKELPNLPRGFFFGATENEFEMAEQLGDNYKFAFVSLHPNSRGFKLLTTDELEPLIRSKRTQFQINLEK